MTKIVLLTMAETVLSEYGYCVLTANSGHKALAILSRGDVQVDLIITDLVMPTMSGRELIERVRRLAPAHADYVHQRLRVAGGQANRHAVFAKTVHEPRIAGESEAGIDEQTRC